MCTIVLLICTTLIAQMIVGAVPPNDVTTGVLSQRQQRQDRISIRRRIVTHDRLDRQRQQRLRQQQVRDQNRERRRSSRAVLTPEQLELRQQGERETRATLTPERLAVRQQQDRDQHSRIRATYTPERLGLRREGERRARAALTPERLEFRQQQDRDWHRRATAAESVRITQDVNDSNESFSIDMLGRPTANHLANFEFDEDKALLLFYENSHDHAFRLPTQRYYHSSCTLDSIHPV